MKKLIKPAEALFSARGTQLVRGFSLSSKDSNEDRLLEAKPNEKFSSNSLAGFTRRVFGALESGGGVKNIAQQFVERGSIDEKIRNLKIKKALEIIEDKDSTAILADSYQIKPRGSYLFAPGLVYCHAVLMVGNDKVGLAHLSTGENVFEKLQIIAQETSPKKIVHLSSSGIPQDMPDPYFGSLTASLSISSFIKEFTKENPQTIHQQISYNFSGLLRTFSLFYDDKDGKDLVFVTNSTEMNEVKKLLNKNTEKAFEL